MKVEINNIPYELKQRFGWVCWQWAIKDEKRTKIPINPNQPSFDGKPNRAKTDTPATWSSFAIAHKTLEENDWLDGIGYVFRTGATPQDTITGIDLDKCRDPLTGMVEPWARRHTRDFNSYCEISPSGTGIKILVYGATESKKTKTREVYSTGRFFTVTGNQCAEYSNKIEHRQVELDSFTSNEDWFPPKPVKLLEAVSPGTCGNGLEDEQVISRATAKNPKFAKLFAGDKSDYKDDHSSADQALCNILAFWTNKDSTAIDRIFKQSKLYREKWDRKDYKERTIGNALASTEEGYLPAPQVPLEEIIGESGQEMEPFVGVAKAVAPVAPVAPPAAPKEYYQPRHAGKRAYSMMDLEALPAPEWLVKDHITKDSISILYGESGALKSFIAVDMSLSIVNGVDYVGCHPVKRGRVVYLAAEGGSGIKARIKVWCLDRDIPMTNPDLCVLTESFDFSSEKAEDSVNEALTIINDYFDGQSVSMLVIDTVARNFMGDENNAKDMGRFVRSMEKFQSSLGCTVLAVHHTGKDNAKGARGSSSLKCASDTMIEVQKSSNGCLVKCDKQKDSEPFGEYILKKEVIPTGWKNEYDEPITSLVLHQQAKDKTAWQLLGAETKAFARLIKSKFESNQFTALEAKQVTGEKSNKMTYSHLGSLEHARLCQKDGAKFYLTNSYMIK